MARSSNSLLVPKDHWEHRRGEGARVWAIILSLSIHAGLLYLAGDWLSERALQSFDTPFIVNLMSIVPDPAPVVREAPSLEDSEPPATEAPAEVVPAADAPAAEGVPDAPPLDPDPEMLTEAPLVEPARGDSSPVEADVVPAPRRDVATEASQRLMEQMEATLPDLPEDLAPRADTPAAEGRPAPRQGAEVGIEGPLGERGLIYFEKPVYPRWAKEAGIEAAVRFEFWVSPAGNVIRIRTLRKSAHPALESLARQSLSRWRFEPLPRGKEHEERGEVPIIWDLQHSESLR